MYILEGKNFTFTIDDQGRCASVVNKLTGHEYVEQASEMWKMIYSKGQQTERPIYSEGQNFTVTAKENTLCLCYDNLASDEGKMGISLELLFTMKEKSLEVTSKICNNSDVTIAEFQLTALSGMQRLDAAEEDYIVWPDRLGKKVMNPAFEHLSVDSGFRIYEMPEQVHTDLNVLYPGMGAMQWFDWCNEKEGIYVGCHDSSHQTICLRAERNVKENTLRLGVIKYPFCDPGETWESAPVVYMVHKDNWHQGAKFYRAWMEESGSWKNREVPDWATEFQGWLRVIMKPHHCEINWDYSQIPALFDEAQAAGMNTLFLLGWEQYGFARMWPDFKVSDDMGGVDGLKAGVDYVHSKGGKVLLFLSYFLIDHQSDFYKNQGGDKCTIKTIWGEDLPFAETYCGEGTYRKLCNPPMPMYAACPSTQGWQDKMLELTKYCMDLGVDGVLYDLGGKNASFCFAKDHPHKKPSHSHCDKDKRFEELRKLVKSYGEDKITMMEYNVDIFGQHMDIVQSSNIKSTDRKFFSELYRYTFPEIRATNRNMAMDEKNYVENINYTFIMGLAYDLSIFRCLGLPSEIPNYTAYMQKALALRKENAKHLIYGTFVDTDGFKVDHPAMRCIGYVAEDGSLGVACWNTAKEAVTFTLSGDNGVCRTETMEGNSIAFYLL